MRRLLVISYFFPPAGNVGVQRTLRFVKRLREFGWEPVVLTAGDAVVESLQPAFGEQIPSNIEIHRTRSFELFSRGYSMRSGLRRGADPGRDHVLSRLGGALWRAAAVPDEKVGWVPYAIARGTQILKNCAVDAIYVTGKPFSSFLIGERLARWFNIPWVMDQRDLWTLNRRDPLRNAWHRWQAPRLERRLIRSASLVIANTNGNRDDYIATFTECPPEKFVTISNGFDADDFNGLSQEKFDRFTISYTGTFYGTRASTSDRVNHETHSPQFLFEAMAQLFQAQPELRERIRVKIAGPKCDYARKLAEEWNVVDAVDLLGRLSHRECLELLSRSHLQLLVCSRGEESRGWVPCKLYQYLAIDTPILALVPEGDASEIIRRTETGVIAPPDDIPAIRNAVMQQFRQWQSNSCRNTFTSRKIREIYQFEGRILCRRFAESLDQLVEAERREHDPSCGRQRHHSFTMRGASPF